MLYYYCLTNRGVDHGGVGGPDPRLCGISNVEIPVFDRRAMDTDRPSQEGREDVPSELSFSVSAPQAVPTPVVTHSSEGTRPEPTSAMVIGHAHGRAVE